MSASVLQPGVISDIQIADRSSSDTKISDTQAIIVDEVFPHTPAAIWKTLTSGALMARWLMEPKGFEPVKGTHFTFQTKPAGAWDGTIRCQVLEVIPHERFAYSWRSGDDGNIGYGAPLETIVTWTLSRADNGTRLRLVHAGFATPKNDTAFQTMGNGWRVVLPRIGTITGEEE